MVNIGAPADTFGPFPANVPEDERFEQPRPNHQDVERRSSGNLGDAPADGGPKAVPSKPWR